MPPRSKPRKTPNPRAMGPRKFLLALAVFFFSAGVCEAQVVADIATGTGTVTNVEVGTVTVRIDVTAPASRVSFELSHSSSTAIRCGYDDRVSTFTVVGGYIGRRVEQGSDKAWKPRIGNRISVFCRAEIGDDLESATVTAILNQTGGI